MSSNLDETPLNNALWEIWYVVHREEQRDHRGDSTMWERIFSRVRRLVEEEETRIKKENKYLKEEIDRILQPEWKLHHDRMLKECQDGHRSKDAWIQKLINENDDLKKEIESLKKAANEGEGLLSAEGYWWDEKRETWRWKEDGVSDEEEEE